MTCAANSFPARLLAAFVALQVFISGCSFYRPRTLTEATYLDRAQTQTDGGATVTVAVLSSRESKKVFGVSLAQKGMQAIWLKIKNAEDVPYIFIERSMDPHYYTAEEAAHVNHFRTAFRVIEYGIASFFFFPALALAPVHLASALYANRKMNIVFRTKGLPSHVVMPGREVAGFVFTNLDEGMREVHVELRSIRGNKEFTFFVTVPGLRSDHQHVDFETMYSPERIVVFDEAGLVRALEQLPCCATNKKGTVEGDPLNLVLVGDYEQVLTIFAAAKWEESERIWAGSVWKSLRAYMFGRQYKDSPVSYLYVKGLHQDISLQKTRERISERLHLRLWYTHVRFMEKPVWIGQVSRDVGVRLTLKNWTLVTHKIDPNVDDARDYVLADLTEIERVGRYGYVRGVGEVDRSSPRKNVTGDRYYTDGLRLVVQLSESRAPLGSFQWDFPTASREALV